MCNINWEKHYERPLIELQAAQLDSFKFKLVSKAVKRRFKQINQPEINQDFNFKSESLREK